MRPYQHLLSVAALVTGLWPTTGYATVYNFFWTSNPALDSTIVSSTDSTLQATGTIDINASAGSPFTLGDIVSTNISVSGTGITNFVFTSWTEAGGTISADGLTAKFSASGNPVFDGTPKFFGCEFPGCGTSLPPGASDIVVDLINQIIPEESVLYGSAEDALASMHMTAASETPLPPALSLFASGLGALGLFGWRRKRKAAALAGTAITAIFLAFSVGVARADTFTTFDVMGSFASPATSLTGTLTVDATLATVTAADLVVGTIPDHFNIVISTTALAAPNSYQVEVNNDVPDQLSIDLDNLSLTTGGAITAGSVFPTCPPATPECIIIGFGELAGSLTGAIAPEVAETPLPAALPLFATGLGAMGLFGWRRKRKSTASIAAA